MKIYVQGVPTNEIREKEEFVFAKNDAAANVPCFHNEWALYCLSLFHHHTKASKKQAYVNHVS